MNGYTEREYTKRFDWTTWKELLRYVGTHRGRIIVMVLLMILVASIDVVQPFITGWLVDTIIIPENTDRLGAFIAVFAGLGLVQAVNIFTFYRNRGKGGYGHLLRYP
jgi:ABC-type multidrug transport system fused ATPase/permease subunit